MSFLALLAHRCDVYDLSTVSDDGSPITTYRKINDKPVRCRLDLNFTRQGKDTLWMSTAATPEDRMGVMFFLPGAPIKSGVRLKMLKGPAGIFQIKGSIDEAWGFDKIDHLEAGVGEVASLQWRAPISQNPGEGF